MKHGHGGVAVLFSVLAAVTLGGMSNAADDSAAAQGTQYDCRVSCRCNALRRGSQVACSP